jgi:hypothetical protein
MQTEYRLATHGSIPPHRAVTRPQLAVDPGNCFTKWVDGSTVRSIPSYVNPHSAPSTVTRAEPCSFAIETAPLVK